MARTPRPPTRLTHGGPTGLGHEAGVRRSWVTIQLIPPVVVQPGGLGLTRADGQGRCSVKLPGVDRGVWGRDRCPFRPLSLGREAELDALLGRTANPTCRGLAREILL